MKHLLATHLEKTSGVELVLACLASLLRERKFRDADDSTQCYLVVAYERLAAKTHE